MVCRKEQSLAIAGIRTPDRASHDGKTQIPDKMSVRDYSVTQCLQTRVLLSVCRLQ